MTGEAETPGLQPPAQAYLEPPEAGQALEGSSALPAP